MKTIEMYLVDGTIMTMQIEVFDLQGFTNSLNDNRILALNINGKVLNKQLINLIVEQTEQEPNVKIQLTDYELLTYTDDYNADEITRSINDQRTIFTVIGNVTFNKRNFKMVEQIA